MVVAVTSSLIVSVSSSYWCGAVGGYQSSGSLLAAQMVVYVWIEFCTDFLSRWVGEMKICGKQMFYLSAFCSFVLQTVNFSTLLIIIYASF